MKTKGRRQSSNIQDRRVSDPLTQASDYVSGQLANVYMGAKLAAQDLSNTGPYDNRTLGDVYKDFVKNTSDATNDNLRGIK